MLRYMGKRAIILEVLEVHICHTMSSCGPGHHPDLGPGLCVRTELQNKVVISLFIIRPSYKYLKNEAIL